MKFCEECGAHLEDDALFCDACGAPCGTEDAQTVPSPAVEPNADTAAQTKKQAAEQEPKKKSNIGILAGLAALAVCIVAAFLFSKNSGKTAPAGTEAGNATEVPTELVLAEAGTKTEEAAETEMQSATETEETESESESESETETEPEETETEDAETEGSLIPEGIHAGDSYIEPFWIAGYYVSDELEYCSLSIFSDYNGGTETVGTAEISSPSIKGWNQVDISVLAQNIYMAQTDEGDVIVFGVYYDTSEATYFMDVYINGESRGEWIMCEHYES